MRDGEPPKDAAIKGRTQIGPAAIVITLVDVVVFLPIAFLPGTVGRFLSEFALVVVTATLDIALHLVHGDAVAGRQLVAALARGSRQNSSIVSAKLFRTHAPVVCANARLPWALRASAFGRHRFVLRGDRGDHARSAGYHRVRVHAAGRSR